MADSKSGRSRDERAPRSAGGTGANAKRKPAAKGQGGRGTGATMRGGSATIRSGGAAKRSGTPKRGGGRRDAAALPLLGPDDDRPYPKSAAGRSRRPLGDRAQSGVRRGVRRDGKPPRKEGEVKGPFKRRRESAAPAKEEGRPVLRLAGKRAPAGARGERGEKQAVKKARKPPGAAATRASKGRAPKETAVGTKGGDSAAARRRRRPTEATEELRRLAGGNANRATETLERASEAFARGRERDALRIMRPLVDAYPKAAAVRELAGLCRYRIGSYATAADDLAVFADLTGSTEQHPVLMDCRRAQGRLRDVEALWEELRETSPSAALVTEGRIVLAGALADAGRLSDAIDLLERRANVSGRVHEHIVRLWYALADLEERAGDVPRARALFEQVRGFDSGYADVAERLAALS